MRMILLAIILSEYYEVYKEAGSLETQEQLKFCERRGIRWSSELVTILAEILICSRSLRNRNAKISKSVMPNVWNMSQNKKNN
jgi:hypothetical protein